MGDHPTFENHFQWIKHWLCEYLKTKKGSGHKNGTLNFQTYFCLMTTQKGMICHKKFCGNLSHKTSHSTTIHTVRTTRHPLDMGHTSHPVRKEKCGKWCPLTFDFLASNLHSLVPVAAPSPSKCFVHWQQCWAGRLTGFYPSGSGLVSGPWTWPALRWWPKNG